MKTINKLLLVLVLFPLSMLAQSTLQGTVLDKAGQGLAGVNIVVKGTKSGTSTDFDGNFTIQNLKKGDVLEFSFLGFKKETLTFSGQKTVKVTMEEEANTLQEMVVIGYGSVKKKDATGSVTLITSKDFNKGSNVTTENLLNGKVAGVTINTSGAPGSGSQIRIRGGASLYASNDPLIVIDGLPIENSTGTGSTSFLASLNPNTIENISVLKDASATAIYGSRASNGVIMITTKKGGKELNVDYNFQYGSGKVIETIDVLSADDFRKAIATHMPDVLSKLGNSNTNWQEAIYRRTDFVDNSLSLRGNLFKVIPTRLSLGNTYQEGLRLTNYFNRNTVSLAMNPSFLKEHLKFRVNANYSNERNRFADAVEGTAVGYDPTQPIYDATSIYGGYFEYYNPANGQIKPQTPSNPVAQLMQTFDRGKYNRIFGNIELDYKFHFFPDLRGVVNIGFDQGVGERTRFAGTDVASSGKNNNIPFGTDEYSTSYRKNKLIDSYLAYNHTFNNLVVDATAGYSYQNLGSHSYVTGNVNDPNLPTTGATAFPKSSIATPVVMIGLFARTNLNFNEKYLLTLSYRRDGSSRFAKENRWGNFPAVAFAWRIKDDFFKNVTPLSDLKLRLGWGITGQQDISSANEYLKKYYLGSGSSQYIVGSTPYPIAVSAPLNENIKWEETYTYNAGFDYGLFNNRLTGSLDFFYKQSNDLLAKVAVPDGSNFSNAMFQNFGSFYTKGIEFTLNANIVKTNDLNWNASFNATAFRREIMDLSLGNVIIDRIRTGDNIAGTGTQVLSHQVGYSPNSFWVYKQLYDGSGNPIQGAFADLNGDNQFNADDKYIYRNTDPDATFGLSSTVNYKNFDFSFNARASVGNRVFNQVKATKALSNLKYGPDAAQNIPLSAYNLGFTNTSDTTVLSDMYIENGSFIRVDNISVGYTFPKWLEGKANLRLFTGVQNAFLITKYSGIDPEISSGIDSTIYPRQRQILFGANVKF